MTDESPMTREQRLDLEDKGYIVKHPDHEDVREITVEDWENVYTRVEPVAAHIMSDGVDMGLEEVAGEESVAELVVKGETIIRLVHDDSPPPPDYSLLETEEANDETACADCGLYRNMVGGLNHDGRPVEGGDFVCWLCADRRGLDVEAAKEALGFDS